MDAAKIFPKRLRYLREKNGATQRTMASYLGIAQAVYYGYEKGLKLPRIDKLPRIADFFGVSVDYLLGMSDEPQLPDKETLAMVKQLQAFRAGGGELKL